MPRLPWRMVYHPAPGPVMVMDAEDNPVARCEHPERSRAASDAVLIAHAPVLLDTLHECADAFRVMAEQDPGRCGALSREMYQRLDQLLRGPVNTWGG